MPQANSLRNIPILDLSRSWIRTSVFIGALPLRGWRSGLAPTDAQLRAELRGQSNPPVKGLCRFASSDLAFLPILQKKDEVTGRERDPLVLKLDTFGETIGRIPVLRGPRLHVL